MTLVKFMLNVTANIFTLGGNFDLKHTRIAGGIDKDILPLLVVKILMLTLKAGLLGDDATNPKDVRTPVVVSLVNKLLFKTFTRGSEVYFTKDVHSVVLVGGFSLVAVVMKFFTIVLMCGITAKRFILTFGAPKIVTRSRRL